MKKIATIAASIVMASFVAHANQPAAPAAPAAPATAASQKAEVVKVDKKMAKAHKKDTKKETETK